MRESSAGRLISRTTRNGEASSTGGLAIQPSAAETVREQEQRRLVRAPCTPTTTYDTAPAVHALPQCGCSGAGECSGKASLDPSPCTGCGERQAEIAYVTLRASRR